MTGEGSGEQAPSPAATLRRLLKGAVRARPAEGLLLSGGLDTSLLAALAHAVGQRPLAVTVCWDREAPDYAYSVELAERLRLPQHVVWADADVLLGALPAVVQILGSFDPMELRNSAVQYLGLARLAQLGIRSAWVGDAADELFAGYSYMAAMEPDQLAAYSRELAGFMRFSAPALGAAVGVEVVSPYLDQAIVAFAVALDPREKVGWRAGERHGKWVLRRAFEDFLPARFVWRTKTPAEVGSGSTRLAGAVLERLPADAFERLRAEALAGGGVRLRDREQAFYYQLYRQQFGPPRERPGAGPRCPECQGPVADVRSRYCGCCGAYPIAPPA